MYRALVVFAVSWTLLLLPQATSPAHAGFNSVLPSASVLTLIALFEFLVRKVRTSRIGAAVLAVIILIITLAGVASIGLNTLDTRNWVDPAKIEPLNSDHQQALGQEYSDIEKTPTKPELPWSTRSLTPESSFR